MGKALRQRRNKTNRANGNEPEPGFGCQNVKRWARYLKRAGCAPVKIKNPEKYLHSHARLMRGLAKALAGA